jgi:hypothetical protein
MGGAGADGLGGPAEKPAEAFGARSATNSGWSNPRPGACQLLRSEETSPELDGATQLIGWNMRPR